MPSGPSLLNDERQGADRAAFALQLDRHVHRDAEFGMLRPLHRVGADDPARLIGEQIDRVRGVVPQQVVGPAARLALGVHVLAAEEIGLDVHLLDVEFAAP